EALLERLAGLDEAGERAVHAGRKVRAAPKEHLAALAHQRHDRRGDARIYGELALGTDAGALLALCHGAGAAAAAELVRPVPVDELQRSPGDGELGVVEHREQGAQTGPAGRVRRRCVLRRLGGPAMGAVQAPYI